MSDRTEPTNPASDEHRWIVEDLTTVEIGGEIVDPVEGRSITIVTIRMPAFVAAHLANALAVLSEIAQMMSGSSYDEFDLAEALRAAAAVVGTDS
jgi:hypothetical protein